jgi:hypothetical protein
MTLDYQLVALAELLVADTMKDAQQRRIANTAKRAEKRARPARMTRDGEANRATKPCRC